MIKNWGIDKNIPFKDGVLGSSPSWVTKRRIFSDSPFLFFQLRNTYVIYSVYILFSEKTNQFYIGYTNDIERRLSEDNIRKGKFNDRGIPWKLVYTEKFQEKTVAHKRETEIKAKKFRSYIIDLINNAQR